MPDDLHRGQEDAATLDCKELLRIGLVAAAIILAGMMLVNGLIRIKTFDEKPASNDQRSS